MGLAHEKKSYLQEKANLFEIGSQEKNDAVWRLSARRHSPLHNNEQELIDNFALPLGSANQCAKR